MKVEHKITTFTTTDYAFTLSQGEARDLLHDMRKLPKECKTSTKNLLKKLDRRISQYDKR